MTREERGFALLIVLWTLVLVTLIVSHVVTSARQETRLAGNLRDAAQLGAIADGGIQQGIYHVLDKSPAHWRADGSLHREIGRLGTVDIRITSEASKVNLNRSSAALLAALLHATGVDLVRAQTIANGIVAWRTQRGEAPSMAEAYKQAGRAYTPPNAPFESVGELGFVLGVTPAILERVAPYVTVYHEGDTDPDAAAPVIRQALKAVFGQVPVGDKAGPDEKYVEIHVVAARSGERAERDAIVRIGPTKSGKLFEILEWNS